MRIKLTLFTALICYGLTVFCQENIRRVAAASLSKDIRDIPDISLSVRWTDSTGDNVLLSTGKIHRPSDDVVFRRAERGLPTMSISDYFKEAVPFVYHFAVRNDTAFLVWKASGTGLSCNVAAKGNTVKSSFVVTDLNQDHIAEVWVIFKAVCVDDEGPNPIKIVMYEQSRRFIQTGTRVLKDGDTVLGGTYSFDEAFQRARAIYREYADRLWRKNAAD